MTSSKLLNFPGLWCFEWKLRSAIVLIEKVRRDLGVIGWWLYYLPSGFKTVTSLHPPKVRDYRAVSLFFQKQQQQQQKMKQKWQHSWLLSFPGHLLEMGPGTASPTRSDVPWGADLYHFYLCSGDSRLLIGLSTLHSTPESYEQSLGGCYVVLFAVSSSLCVWLFVCLFACLLACFSETGFLFPLCNSSGCPGSQFVGQAGLELTEIHLPLPPKCWD